MRLLLRRFLVAGGLFCLALACAVALAGAKYPGNKEAIAKTNPKVAADLPTNPQNMKTGFIVNAKFWGDNLDALRERFNVWVAQ